MRPDTANRPARRLLWHGNGGPCPDLERALDGIPAGPLTWRPGPEPGLWQSDVALEALAAGTLCIPSLVPNGCAPARYRMRATWDGGGAAELVAIAVTAPAEAAADWPAADHGPVGPAGRRAQAGIDCLEAVDDLPGFSLTIIAETGSEPPQADLAVSLRPRFDTAIADDGTEVRNLEVPAFSQMQCSEAVARHVCSPVSLAMVLGSFGFGIDPEAFAHASRHPRHRLFGIWPANLAAAWHHGATGVIRTFDSAADAAHVLATGRPIVASIRFEAGALDNAPLPRTGGHLVVLRGLGAERVLVNDPAGPDATAVVREYDRPAFLRAWLADRGAGYVLWPRREAVR